MYIVHPPLVLLCFYRVCCLFYSRLFEGNRNKGYNWHKWTLEQSCCSCKSRNHHCYCNFLSTALSCYLNLVAVVKRQLDKWDFNAYRSRIWRIYALGFRCNKPPWASVTYFVPMRLACMIHCWCTAERVFVFVHDVSAALQRILFVYTGPTRSSGYTWRKGEFLLCIFNTSRIITSGPATNSDPFKQPLLAVS